MNGRYSRCSSNISDYVIDIEKKHEMPDNTKVTPNISDSYQPASMQMNRRNLLINLHFLQAKNPLKVQ